MRCYYHPEADACGICKSCQRGICRACVAEVGRGIACSGRCESDVQALQRLVEQSTEMGADTGKLIEDSNRLTRGSTALLTETFYLVVGGIFLAVGGHERVGWIAMVGGAFLVFGAFGLYRVIKARRNARN